MDASDAGDGSDRSGGMGASGIVQRIAARQRRVAGRIAPAGLKASEHPRGSRFLQGYGSGTIEPGDQRRPVRHLAREAQHDGGGCTRKDQDKGIGLHTAAIARSCRNGKDRAD